MLPLTAVLLAVAARPAPVQDAATPSPEATARALAGEALANGRAYAMLQRLCRDHPHRLSGSAGAEGAVAWAVRTMEEVGLENVRREACRVPRWVRGRVARLEVVEPASARDTYLPILALGGSVGTPPEGIRAGVVAVRSFGELAELGEAARGKLVLFDRPMDPTEPDPFRAYGRAVDQRSRGAVEAARAGALGAIVRSMTLRLDDHPHTGSLGYADEVPPVPGVALSTAGAARLGALLDRGPVELRLVLDCRDEGEVDSANVVGEIRGRELPDEIVLVGAHLDGWDVGQGAHDDGAGCVQSIEALRLVRALGLRPRRTLRAVLFMNEENGLRGARAYAREHAAEVERHVLAIESDRGGFAPRGFRTNAAGGARAELERVAALCAPLGAGALLDGDGGADLIPLRPAGVVVMELLPDAARYFDVHHSARDTLETVHPRELALGAAALAVMAFTVADAPATLPREVAGR